MRKSDENVPFDYGIFLIVFGNIPKWLSNKNFRWR